MATKSATRVGALLLAAIAVMAAGILVIGQKNNLFSRKEHYYIEIPSASGLKAGNPVHLDGVDVGTIEHIILPRSAEKHDIRVEVKIDHRYAERVRGPENGQLPRSRLGVNPPPPSRARIKTLGLLGDKYIEINSGDDAYPIIPEGGRIPAAAPTNVDALLASGEDVMDNVVTISSSLSKILTRMERGEGLLGELTSANSESGRRIRESLVRTSESVDRIADRIDHGEGILPRLLQDRALANRLDTSLARLDGLLAKADSGPGLLPGLLNDPSSKDKFDATLANLQGVSADLKRVSAELETKNGALPRLIRDEEYGKKVTDDLADTVARLHSVAEKLDHGQGSAAMLVNDPRIYEAINDIIVGVHESRMLRWLIRNRQKAGIKKRYNDEVRAAGPEASPAAPPAGEIPEAPPPAAPPPPAPPS